MFFVCQRTGERSSNGREVAVTGQPSTVCQPLLLCSAASANAHIVELIPGLDAVEHETTAGCSRHSHHAGIS
eukprot:scaffold114507_cov37-Phaeocystis_antarctica.AAC.1